MTHDGDALQCRVLLYIGSNLLRKPLAAFVNALIRLHIANSTHTVNMQPPHSCSFMGTETV